LGSYGQYNLDYGFTLGASNYFGDIGGSKVSGGGILADADFGKTRWTNGGFVRYKFLPFLAAKGSFNYLRISGDDSKSDNPVRKARNLNFRNDILEFALTGEFSLYRSNDVGRTGTYNTDFNLYLFGGVGFFYSNPKGQKVTGEWVALRPLQSEGVAYGSMNFVIPVGGGFYYTFKRKLRIGLEFNFRKVFTDYLDDISAFYANDYDGITNKTSQPLLDQINEENGFYPGILISNFDADSKRGGPDSKDAYMSAVVNLSYVFRGKSSFYKSKNSWVLGKNKKRRRKSRAKF
jgi:hypothetical protein